jgi:hypothetical protein
MGVALREAVSDFYSQSWRLALLNAALSLAVVPLLLLALWVPLVLVVAALVAGPLAMALMHCAVTLAETDDLRLGVALAGLRLHWRRGLALGAAAGLVLTAGVYALTAYGRAGAWPLAALVVYLLFAFGVLQLCLWPLAVHEPGSPIFGVLRAAVEVMFRRPLETLALGAVLLALNLAGAAAALMPLLTLTVAFTFLAAAHYVLPRNPLREARSWLE